jgi:metal-sulfur cluster biosynthetic enzyme
MNTEEKQMNELLRGVIDPELMVNIVDLGLVYGIKYNEADKQIDVALTLTSPGCPLGGVIIEDAQKTLEISYPDCNVDINLVWEPVWSVEMLTERGKAELGFS